MPAEPEEQFTQYGEILTSGYEIRSVGCRSRFCSRCCTPLGVMLRIKLERALRAWGGSCVMVTLTVDPDLFEGDGESAYRYVREKRAVAVLVRRLRSRGLVEGRHYFCVLEFQQNGFPHWHLLLNSRFVPHAELTELWDRNRPKSRGDVVPGRPGFGFVFVTRPKFEGGAVHAARYVAKYLTKHPEAGYPAWVLSFEGRLPKFHTSRGFWKELCGDDLEELPELLVTEEQFSKPDDTDPELLQLMLDDSDDEGLSTVAERLSKCGQRAVVVHVYTLRRDDRKQSRPFFEFVTKLPCDYADVGPKLFGHRPFDGPRWQIDEETAEELRRMWQDNWAPPPSQSRERPRNNPNRRQRVLLLSGGLDGYG